MALSLEGFPQSALAPGIGIQLNFASGPISVPSPDRAALYVGPMSSGATATANTAYQIKGDTEANSLFGRRSRLARALRKHFRVNPRSSVWAVGYTLVAGTAPTATATFTGTATGSGVATAVIAGNTVQYAYKTGDTPTVIAAGLATNTSANLDLPATAASAVGVYTLTHVHAAASANGDCNFRVSVTSGTGVSVAASGASLGTGTGVVGVDGGTTEISLFQAALDAVANRGIYYLGPLLTTAASLAAVLSHVHLKNTAGVGKRCVSINGYKGSVSTGNTLALAINRELMSIVSQLDSEHDIAELVGIWLAVRQNRENASQFNAANLNSFRTPQCLPVASDASRYDDDDIQSMLQNGVSPIQTDEIGAYLVKFVTTRSKNPAGTVDDQRAADVHKISVLHNWADRLTTRWGAKYPNFFLRPDKKLPNGNIDHSQPIDRGVLQPSLLKMDAKSFTQEYRPILQDVEAAKASINCDISDQNSSRLELTINLAVVNLASQFGVEANEVSA